MDIDLRAKDAEVTEARQALELRQASFGEARTTQAELLKKERDLADAKHELEPTIEQRAQDSLGTVRHKTKRGAPGEPDARGATGAASPGGERTPGATLPTTPSGLSGPADPTH